MKEMKRLNYYGVIALKRSLRVNSNNGGVAVNAHYIILIADNPSNYLLCFNSLGS